jgi:methanogenic corrinoid protein MtbC1
LLVWCVYCQEFQGEKPPFADLSITHGICAQCRAKSRSSLEEDIGQARRLQEIQRKLMDVGKRGDIKAAKEIVTTALLSGVRCVDILIGVIAPLLYTVGAEWEQGKVSVEQEHQFTSFCENIFQFLSAASNRSDPVIKNRTDPKVLVLNGDGNHHTLGVRILAMSLKSKGFSAREFTSMPQPAKLLLVCQELRPIAVLVSLTLAEQREGVLSVIDTLNSCTNVRTKVVVGGYAVKMGLVAEIPGAQLVANITDLVDLLRLLSQKGQTEI